METKQFLTAIAVPRVFAGRASGTFFANILKPGMLILSFVLQRVSVKAKMSILSVDIE